MTVNTNDPVALMQMAVDIVTQSPHPGNKVAGAIAGKNSTGQPFQLARTNGWPAPIANHFGHDREIGNSSGTVHAETACILAAPCTKGGAIYLTDPPCPNCAKNIAEAGLSIVYIDHKGFEKDFAQRRGMEFENLSLPIFKACGIAVHEIRRKDGVVGEILPAKPEILPQNPADLSEINGTIKECISALVLSGPAYHFAGALVRCPDQKIRLLIARAGIVCNLQLCSLPREAGKYSSLQQPLNRLLMAARFHGVDILPETLYASRIPTARELVNMIGAGLDQIMIGDQSQSRDPEGLEAMDMLVNAGILTITSP